jgi:hypothetical protein
MLFLKRHRFALLCLAVIFLASILVVRQFQANESAHSTLREDLILLVEKGKNQEAEHVYQKLVTGLSSTSDEALLDDLQRTSLLLDSKAQDPSGLVSKYHAAVKQYLEKRSEKRLAAALQRAAKD